MAIELFNNGNHRCLLFEDLVSCSRPYSNTREEDICHTIQSNQFLIVDNGHAALLDPGGNLTYNRLFMSLRQYANIRDLDYVIASHQDPDVVGSLNKWLVGSNCNVIVPKLWERFVPHFCSPGATDGRLLGIPDEGIEIEIGNSVLLAVPAHFLHSEGNFHFYDLQSKILFTGDVGASHVDQNELSTPVKDFLIHVPRMKAFHQRYMNANKVCRLWVNMIRTLDVEWIVPQHGPSFKGKAMVAQFLDWFESLQCGVDLMEQVNYHASGVARLSQKHQAPMG